MDRKSFSLIAMAAALGGVMTPHAYEVRASPSPDGFGYGLPVIPQHRAAPIQIGRPNQRKMRKKWRGCRSNGVRVRR